MLFAGEKLCKRQISVLFGACLVFFIPIGIAYGCRSLYLTEAMVSGVISGELMSVFWLLSSILICLGAFIGAFVIRKAGLNKTILLGGLLMGFGYIVLYNARGLFSFLLSSILMGVGGVMTGKVSVQMVILKTFPVNSNRYLGILAASSSFGMVIGSPLLGQIIFNFGWRNACLYTGIAVMLVSCFCCLVLLRGNFGEVNIKKALRPTFSLHEKRLFAGLILFVACAAVITSSMVSVFSPIMAEKGMASYQIADIFGVYALTCMVNVIIGGAIADRCGYKAVFAYAGICTFCGLLLMYFGQSNAVFFITAILMGTWGVTVHIFPLGCASGLFPHAYLQRIQTGIVAAGAFSMIISAVFSGLIFKFWHSYMPFIVMMFVFVLIAIMLAMKLMSTQKTAREQTNKD